MSERSLELSDAISALVVQQPFYAVLLFDLLEIQETTAVKTAATDGAKVYVNPEFFKRITVQERIGVIAHEILHCVLQHPTRGRGYKDLGVGPDLKPWNHTKMNYAMDYIINQMVAESGMQMPLGSLFNPQITSNDIADEVYCKIPDPPEDDDNWDVHMDAADPAAVPDKSTIQRATAMAAAAAKAANSQGVLPACLARLVTEVCEPKVKWTDHVQRTIQTLSGHDDQSWAKLNRRRLASPPHICWPGRVGSRSGTLVIEVDTSGSIDDAMINTFFGEIHGVLQDCLPEKTYVGFVDAALFNDELIEMEDTNDMLDLHKHVGGGGGTDMTVIFDEIEKRSIPADYVIVLTDGYTPFGEDVGIPTIWCITTEGVKAPWGVTVHCKL